MVLFVLFGLAAWGACFLLAEARIFGCDATGFSTRPDENDYFEFARYRTWVKETGVIKIRQRLLRFTFFEELFSCYFCLGSLWVGVPLHFAFRYLFAERYFLHHDWSCVPTLVSTAIAMLASGSMAYMLDKVVRRLE